MMWQSPLPNYSGDQKERKEAPKKNTKSKLLKRNDEGKKG